MPNTPEEIHGVSQSQFSIARHYGGIKFNGTSYTYDPKRDVLVRDDVLKRRVNEAKKIKAKLSGGHGPACSENGILGFTNEEIESLTQPKG